MSSDEEQVDTRDNSVREDIIVQQMEDILEKLKLLQYEKEMSSKKFTPITRTFFALPEKSNASLQFNTFMDIATFLFEKCDQSFSVDKYDDPNTSVNKLLLTLKSISVTVDFPTSKLKQGYGEAVCQTLVSLCDKALDASKFNWAKPSYPKEDFADEAEVDEDAEVDGDSMDDEGEVPEEDREEEEVLYSDLNRGSGKNNNADLEESSRQIIVASVDPIEWKTELERVGPKLKARVKADAGKEWRTHIEATAKHTSTINKMLPSTTAQLTQVSKNLGEAMERMEGKERYINMQFESLCQDYQDVKKRLDDISTNCKDCGERVNVMSNEYASLSEALSEIKSHMDNRGSKMTDTSPLVKIKEALSTLKGEINTFELRIGILGHTLLHAKSNVSKMGGPPVDPEDDDFVSDDELYN